MWKRLIVVSGLMALACSPQQAATPKEQEDAAADSSVPAPIAPENAPEIPTRPVIVTAKPEQLPAAPEGALTVDGWGPIRIGMTLDELNAATGSKITLADDPFYQDGECTYLTPKGAPEGLAVMFADGRVSRIDIDKPGAATYGGLGIGSTEAEVRRVFGKNLNSEPEYYDGLPAEYLTIWTVFSDWPLGAAETPELLQGYHAARGLRFETGVEGEEGKVIGFRAGDGSITLVEGCS